MHMSRGTIELDIEEKVADPECNDHLPVRRRWSFRARSREPAENGLQKRPFHGWRVQSLESRRFANNELTDSPRPFLFRCRSS